MADDENDATMSDLFDRALTDLDYFDNLSAPIGDAVVQEKLKKAVTNCEQLVTMSNELEIFSSNEDIEDISTKDLRYLLLPAFLAHLKGKETGDRLEIVKNCNTYCRHFLQLCRLYGLTTFTPPTDHSEIEPSESKPTPLECSIEDMSREREEKVKRFKYKRQLKTQLSELKIAASGKNPDDSVVREYYIKLIEMWVSDSIDSLQSIDQELHILKHMAGLTVSNSKIHSHGKPKDDKKFKPFILTRDSMQKKVFGLGYPSVPIFSVDEFYDQRVAAGLFPSPGSTPKNPAPNQDADKDDEDKIAKETAVERDDAEELRRLRDWDEFRDDHRRGWGNTHNKG